MVSPNPPTPLFALIIGISTYPSPTLPALSYSVSDDEPEDDDEEFNYLGDYSSRMEELLDGEDEEELPGDDEDDPQDPFVYTGIDVEEPSGGYRDQLQYGTGLGRRMKMRRPKRMKLHPHYSTM
jgi:hypothetical protein